jgi:hypothetical protein
VKTIYLTKGLVTALLLASTSSLVIAEDFEPQIVYQDKDYISSHGQSSGSTSSSSSSSSSSNVAGDFTPQILYQDKDYISSNSSRKSTTARKSSVSSSTSSQSSSSSNEAEAPASGGMNQYLIGIIALLGIAFALHKRSGANSGDSESSQSSAPVRNTSAGGGTGVANYLKENDMAEASGVAKYLEQQTIANASGVEKYLRNQA